MGAQPRQIREDVVMNTPQNALSLRIFTSMSDRWGLHPLYEAIVERAREMHLAGATVVRGPLGFGYSRRLRKGRLLALSENLPVVIEIVDTEENINEFLPVLDGMMESGLVTIQKAQVLRYSRQRQSFARRLKEHFSRETVQPP
jgi:PII-like signaling protein